MARRRYLPGFRRIGPGRRKTHASARPDCPRRRCTGKLGPHPDRSGSEGRWLWCRGCRTEVRAGR